MSELFTFGIISDIQYADFENGSDFTGTNTRYYRGALEHVKEAVTTWETASPEFVLQLGDIIDGKNSRCTPPISSQALTTVLDVMSSRHSVKYHHLIGNHELYNFTKEFMVKSPLNSGQTNDATKMYYTFSPVPGFRFVILDTYGMSILGCESTETSPVYTMAKDLLLSKNSNKDLNESRGLIAENKRFTKYNGGIDMEQLGWLDGVLEEAARCGEKVIVAGHIPVYIAAATITELCWNYQETLAVLQKHGCVVAYLAGHQHDGGYAVDETGIHHVTFEGVVETPPGLHCYATAHVFTDRIHIEGFGRVQSRNIPFS